MIQAPHPGLLESRGTNPVTWSVLGATLHFEPLRPEHEPAFEAANALILEWFGKELRWTSGSVTGLEREFEAEDLEFVSTYPQNLVVEVTEPEFAEEEKELAGLELSEYALDVHGGSDPSEGSPFSYSFFADVPYVPEGELLPTVSVLRLTVPEDAPLGIFEQRLSAIVALLPVRWAAAGYTFAGNEVTGHALHSRRVYAHARRHPGYDVGNDRFLVEEFHDRIRSVNWLTYVGDELGNDLALPADTLVSVSQVGRTRLLRAGDQPERGDHNRGVYPPAYCRADALVRPVRAAGGLDFADPWDQRSTEAWLRRFERRAN